MHGRNTAKSKIGHQKVSSNRIKTCSSRSSIKFRCKNEAKNKLSERIDDNLESQEKHLGKTESRCLSTKTDMHWKNSNNKKLREWFKRKNNECRLARRAIVTKKRQERSNKLVEEQLRIARHEKSAECVKKWIESKRKEASNTQLEIRKHNKETDSEKIPERNEDLSGRRMNCNLPKKRFAPYIQKCFRKHNENDATVEYKTLSKCIPNGESLSTTSNIVSDNHNCVRKQMANKDARDNNSTNVDGNNQYEQNNMKHKRMSYDAWLLSKRKLEEKTQPLAKKSGSDTEINLKTSPLGVHLKQVSDTFLDRSISAADNCNDESKVVHGKSSNKFAYDVNDSDNISTFVEIRRSDDKTKASLVEMNTRAKQTSAKARKPILQCKFSRHTRSYSALDHGRYCMPRECNENEEEKIPKLLSTKMPFPGEFGVPDHVSRVQERLFFKKCDQNNLSDSRIEVPDVALPVDFSTNMENVVHVNCSSELSSTNTLEFLQAIEVAPKQNHEYDHSFNLPENALKYDPSISNDMSTNVINALSENNGKCKTSSSSNTNTHFESRLNKDKKISRGSCELDLHTTSAAIESVSLKKCMSKHEHENVSLFKISESESNSEIIHHDTILTQKTM